MVGSIAPLQFHPCDIAGVVIVREKSIGASSEEFLESGFGRGVGSVAQKFRGQKKFALIFEAVGNDLETLALIAVA